MKKLFSLAICCIAVVLSLTGMGQAASVSTIDFDFRYLSFPLIDAGDSISFTEDGLTVTASAMSGGSAALVNRTPFGLGVSSWPWVNPEIDGVFQDDLLLLSFDQDVAIQSAAFTIIFGNSEFQLFVDGVSLISDDIPGDRVYSFAAKDSILPTGRDFGLSVANWNDHYKLAGVTVEVTNTPIPAAGLLFVSSLAGVLAVRKRRR